MPCSRKRGPWLREEGELVATLQGTRPAHARAAAARTATKAVDRPASALEAEKPVPLELATIFGRLLAAAYVKGESKSGIVTEGQAGRSRQLSVGGGIGRPTGPDIRNRYRILY